jgi:uncharacterized repeat protein (TIGR01451 family)
MVRSALERRRAGIVRGGRKRLALLAAGAGLLGSLGRMAAQPEATPPGYVVPSAPGDAGRKVIARSQPATPPLTAQTSVTPSVEPQPPPVAPPISPTAPSPAATPPALPADAPLLQLPATNAVAAPPTEPQPPVTSAMSAAAAKRFAAPTPAETATVPPALAREMVAPPAVALPLVPPPAAAPVRKTPPGDSVPPIPPAPRAAPLARSALCLEKTGPTSARAGETVHYEITVRNTTAEALAGVLVSELLPEGVAVVRTDPAALGEYEAPLPAWAPTVDGRVQPAAPGQAVVWEIGRLESGAERRLRIELRPSRPGDFTSTTTASFLAIQSVNTRVAAAPGLALKVTAPATKSIGEKVDFQLEVTNASATPAVNVVLNVRLPANLEHPAGTEIEADLGTLAAGGVRKVKLSAVAAKAGPALIITTATAASGARAQFQTSVDVREPDGSASLRPK